MAFSVLEAGADTVYVGVRGWSRRGSDTELTDEEVQDLCNVARAQGKHVRVVLNTMPSSEEVPLLLKKVDMYAGWGVSGFMISDIGSMVPSQRTQSLEELNANLDRLLDYLARHPHLARLIQRAALDDSRYLESAVTGLLRPFYAQSSRALAGAEQIWSEKEIPHLGAGLYLIIFGYFANAPLLGVMLDEDPLSEPAVQRQRRFVKEAVARLLGLAGSSRPRPD